MAFKGVGKTVCEGYSAAVALEKCPLHAKNIDPSRRELNDPTCKSVIDPDANMLTFHFDARNQCGSVAEKINGTITYKNVIKLQNSSGAIIPRESQFQIHFSCSYLKPVVTPMTFKIKDSSVVQTYTDGNLSFSVEMHTYTDAAQTTSIDQNTELGPKVWVELSSDIGKNSLVHLVVKACWATRQAAPDSAPKYSPITDRCSAGATVAVLRNGEGTLNTSNDIQFPGQRLPINLRCEIELCDTLQGSCTQNCSGKKKSLKQERENQTSRADGNRNRRSTRGKPAHDLE